MDGQANDKALQKFADLMVKKLTEVDADWHKPWFTTTGYGLPQNIDGRVYNGINSFMLFLLQEERSFQTPVYMTFPQAKKQGLHINKGASANLPSASTILGISRCGTIPVRIAC